MTDPGYELTGPPIHDPELLAYVTRKLDEAVKRLAAQSVRETHVAFFGPEYMAYVWHRERYGTPDKKPEDDEKVGW